MHNGKNKQFVLSYILGSIRASAAMICLSHVNRKTGATASGQAIGSHLAIRAASHDSHVERVPQKPRPAGVTEPACHHDAAECNVAGGRGPVTPSLPVQGGRALRTVTRAPAKIHRAAVSGTPSRGCAGWGQRAASLACVLLGAQRQCAGRGQRADAHVVYACG